MTLGDASNPEPLPRLELLGAPYDVVNGRYADAASCGPPVIDWSKIQTTPLKAHGEHYYAVPNGVGYGWKDTVYSTYYYGESAQDYQKSLSSHTELSGEYAWFSGSLSVDFNDSQKNSLASLFTRYNSLVTLYSLTLPHIDEIHKYFFPSFINDLEKEDPIKFYQKYGTHLVNKILVGGRASFVYATDRRQYNSSTNIDVAVQMDFKFAVGSASGQEKLKYQEAVDQLRTSSTRTIKTQGGDAQYADDKFPENAGKWQNSVYEDPVLIDFGDKPCFIALWTIASTPERQEALKKALTDLYKLPSELPIPGPYLQVHQVMTTDDELLLVQSVSEQVSIFLWGATIDNNYYYLGEAVTPEYPDKVEIPILLVKELVEGALSPVKWQEVATWQPKTPQVPHTFKYWKAVPPKDYVSLCDVGLWSDGGVTPDQALVKYAKGFRAVHKSVVQKGMFGKNYAFREPDVGEPANKVVWFINDSQSTFPPFWKLGTSGPLFDPWVLDSDPKKITIEKAA